MKPYAKVLPKGPFATVPSCTVCQRNPERCNSDMAECSHVDCPHRGKAWANDRQRARALHDGRTEPVIR